MKSESRERKIKEFFYAFGGQLVNDWDAWNLFLDSAFNLFRRQTATVSRRKAALFCVGTLSEARLWLNVLSFTISSFTQSRRRLERIKLLAFTHPISLLKMLEALISLLGLTSNLSRHRWIFTMPQEFILNQWDNDRPSPVQLNNLLILRHKSWAGNCT